MNNNINNNKNDINKELDLDFSVFNNTPMGSNNNNNFGNINSLAESEHKDNNNVESLDDDNGENKNK